MTPEIDDAVGDYFRSREICKIVHYRMGLENDARMMSAKIAITNVASERCLGCAAGDAAYQNIAMKAVFDQGECKSCL